MGPRAGAGEAGRFRESCHPCAFPRDAHGCAPRPPRQGCRETCQPANNIAILARLRPRVFSGPGRAVPRAGGQSGTRRRPGRAPSPRGGEGQTAAAGGRRPRRRPPGASARARVGAFVGSSRWWITFKPHGRPHDAAGRPAARRRAPGFSARDASDTRRRVGWRGRSPLPCQFPLSARARISRPGGPTPRPQRTETHLLINTPSKQKNHHPTSTKRRPSRRHRAPRTRPPPPSTAPPFATTTAS